MTFDNHFALEDMMNQARERFSSVEQQIRSVEETLNDRLGGKSRGSLIGGMVASAVWLAVYLGAYLGLDTYGFLSSEQSFLPPEVSLAALAVSLALVAFLLLSNAVQMKYYGAILDARERLLQLKERVEMGKNALPARLSAFLDAREGRWDLPLTAAPSIPEETMGIAAQLSGMEALSGGFISSAKNVLYYVTCVAWTLAGCSAIIGANISVPGLDGTFSPDTIRSILFACTVLTCVGEAIIAKLIWGKCGCSVTNAALFATVLGPLVFVLLILLVVLVVVVVQLVIAIAAVVIAGMCLIGSVSGG